MAEKSSNKKMNKRELEEALLENFVNLQKVLTNLSSRFEDMSSNVSKLLQLFELSAKSFAERQSDEMHPKVDKEFLERLDSLLDQNKVISKGIMLMEERIRGRNTPPEEPRKEIFRPRPMPRLR